MAKNSAVVNTAAMALEAVGKPQRETAVVAPEATAKIRSRHAIDQSLAARRRHMAELGAASEDTASMAAVII
jgi:hypothetical protein